MREASTNWQAVFYCLALISPSGAGARHDRLFIFQGWAMTNKNVSRVGMTISFFPGWDMTKLFFYFGWCSKIFFSSKNSLPPFPLISNGASLSKQSVVNLSSVC
tara:strand:+ start:621 stop:932 length:312 start_codon:yes stop_codon:yes gene_type:complete